MLLDIEFGKFLHANRSQPIVAITLCAVCLLRVILQRPGNATMHRRTDIGLIDAHPESIRRGDDPKLPSAKRLLHIALAVQGKACVKEIRSQPLPFQELCHLFLSPPRVAQ